MTKQKFEALKAQIEKDIQEICKENKDGAVYVVIGAITARAGGPEERKFSESQLKELFELADQ